MAHSVLWSKKPSFHPIGSTTPVSLTHSLAPEEDARILLLGCGDPRSILYTIHADLGTYDRKLDFTTCDLEPAILARNILLLTMIIDEIAVVTMWRIFYHFLLDDESLQILLCQCRKLSQCCTNLDTWNASQYGVYLRFSTDHTLMEIKRHWQLCTEMDLLPEKDKQALKETFISSMKSVVVESRGTSVMATRACGPLGQNPAVEATQVSLMSLWTTGVLNRVTSPLPPSPHVNPTFVYSRAGRTFNIFPTTDPLSVFHLAPALAETKDGPPIQKVGAEPFYTVALAQFTSWCSSFKTRIEGSSSVVIRFFVGDAIAFCHALRVCKEESTVNTGIYTSQWGLSRINFSAVDYEGPSSPAPLSFNVIDASNLKDNLGLLNILLVTVPLLQRTPWAVIHTSTLVSRDPATSPIISSLDYRTFADIPTLSIFIGVAPTSHLHHFTSHSDKHEILASSKFHHMHETIAWKFPSAVVSGSPIPFPELDERPPTLVCNAQHLGNFLFTFYSKMFEEERLKPMKYETAYRFNIIHYTRASFVAFVASVKERVDIDWDEAIGYFLGHVSLDHAPISGPSYYQELACQLYLRGLCSKDALRWNYTPERVRFVDEDRGPDDFPGWKDVPLVVCVVLKVPRQYLKVLEDMDLSEPPIPILQCQTKGPLMHNFHPQIRPTFGDVEVSNADEEPHVVIKEDPQGWQGDSPLIVTFDAPSWIFAQRGQFNEIGLHIRATPATVKGLKEKLSKLVIYETRITDVDHVFIVRRRPNEDQDISPTEGALPASGNEVAVATDRVTVVFDELGTKARSLIIRDEIKDAKNAKTLARGAKGIAEPVTDTGILVTYHGYENLFRYPFPVSSAKVKPKIERKLTPPYIEIECPIRPDFSSFVDLSLNLYPIARGDSYPTLLNIHYLKLDVLPALRFPVPANQLIWLNNLLGLSFSDQERKIQNTIMTQAKRPMMVNLKETLVTMFIKWSGLDTPHARLNPFALLHPIGGIHTLIIVNDIRLDLASHGAVLDACVIPFTGKNVFKLMKVMDRFIGQGLTEIRTVDEELQTWRHLVPTYAERCRTWKHTKTCEYRKEGIPSEDQLKSPLCSCGKGKDLGAFGRMSEWVEAHDEATRVAIGPLYAFTFTEKATEETSQAPLPDRCSNCAGPGQPKLLACGACKKEKYCTPDCQKRHWKAHKPHCRK